MCLSLGVRQQFHHIYLCRHAVWVGSTITLVLSHLLIVLFCEHTTQTHSQTSVNQTSDDGAYTVLYIMGQSVRVEVTTCPQLQFLCF